MIMNHNQETGTDRRGFKMEMQKMSSDFYKMKAYYQVIFQMPGAVTQ